MISRSGRRSNSLRRPARYSRPEWKYTGNNPFVAEPEPCTASPTISSRNVGSWKQTLPRVCPGVSTTSKDSAPRLIRSPSRNGTSGVNCTRSVSWGERYTGAPLSRRSASLPPEWSKCPWVLQIAVMPVSEAPSAVSAGSSEPGMKSATPVSKTPMPSSFATTMATTPV